MNWVFYILTAVLMVGQIFLDYLLKVIFRDARTSEHKTFRRVLLFVTLTTFFVGLASTILKERQEQSEKANLVVHLNTIKGSNTNLVQEVSGLRGDNLRLKRAISDLMQAHIDNEKADLDSRSKMLEAKRVYEIGETRADEWGALISTFQNKRSQTNLEVERQRLETVDEQKRVVGPLYPIWEYSIRTYQTLLADYAGKQKGAKITSNFVSLPSLSSVCVGYTSKTGNYGRYVEVCEIGLGTNFAWRCKCRLWVPDRTGSGGHCAVLNFECDGKKGLERLSVARGSGSETLMICLEGREPHPVRNECRMSDYRKHVDEALHNLIAAEDDNIASSAK